MSESNILRIKSEKGNMYIFDALSNNIYQIEDEEDFNSITLNDLGHRNTRRVEADTSSDVHSAVLNHAKTLVIELTEKCNLRCTYCVFDEDSELDRNHTNKSIDFKKALKSINSFYKRTSNGIAYIVFYGGEPLLAFENIVKLVHHANKISNNKVKFSFTTNGTLLTKEKFDFLVSNDFLITVSLDGNKKIHDITRVTRKGNGKWDI